MGDLSDEELKALAIRADAISARGSRPWKREDVTSVRALIAEVRRRRAAPSVALTEEDRETLEWVRSLVPLAVLDRLLAAPAGGQGEP